MTHRRGAWTEDTRRRTEHSIPVLRAVSRRRRAACHRKIPTTVSGNRPSGTSPPSRDRASAPPRARSTHGPGAPPCTTPRPRRECRPATALLHAGTGARAASLSRGRLVRRQCDFVPVKDPRPGTATLERNGAPIESRPGSGSRRRTHDWSVASTVPTRCWSAASGHFLTTQPPEPVAAMPAQARTRTRVERSAASGAGELAAVQRR